MRRKPKRDYTPIVEPLTVSGNYELTAINSHGLLDVKLDELFSAIRADLHKSLDQIVSGEVEVASVEGSFD